jgi:hypothetical protein
MPVESVTFADSTDPEHNGGITGIRLNHDFHDATPGNIAETIYDKLIEAGWTNDGGYKAGFSAVFPSGLPWVPTPPDPEPEEKTVIQNGIRIAYLKDAEGMIRQIHFYNPYTSEPDPNVPHIWLEMGDTHQESIDNYVGVLVLAGWVHVGTWTKEDGFETGFLHIDFEAPVAGFLWNDEIYGGDSFYRASANTVGTIPRVDPLITPQEDEPPNTMVGPVGGGLIAEAIQKNGEASTTWVTVGCLVDVGVPPTATFIVANEGGGHAPTLRLSHGAGAGYRIVANQFQFFVWRPGSSVISSAGKNQLAVIFPKLEWENHGVTQGLVVLGNDTFRRHLRFIRGKVCGAANSGITRFLDTNEYNGTHPSFYPIRFLDEVLTHDDRPVATTAWISAPINLAEPKGDADNQARIIGIVWDALIVHEKTMPLGSQRIFASRFLEKIGRESQAYSVPAGLWVSFTL